MQNYAIDKQVVDSAASATAIFSGVKTKYGRYMGDVYSSILISRDTFNAGTLGFDSHVERGHPESLSKLNEVETMLTWAQEAGMDTGFVTTARITHATPAALYAHTFERDYECDTK